MSTNSINEIIRKIRIEASKGSMSLSVRTTEHDRSWLETNGFNVVLDPKDNFNPDSQFTNVNWGEATTGLALKCKQIVIKIVEEKQKEQRLRASQMAALMHGRYWEVPEDELPLVYEATWGPNWKNGNNGKTGKTGENEIGGR